MFLQTLPILVVLFSLSQRLAHAQAGTTSVGPLLECTLTTFSCPGVNGCCTIGGCCGGGCCPNGYSCINEGTSDQACCPVTDSTLCGTVTPGSGSDPGSGSGSGACLGIDNCPRDPERGLAWTCLLGKKCGLSYNQCYPCIPDAGGDDSSATTPAASTPSSDSGSSGSDSSSSSETSSSSSSSPSSSSSGSSGGNSNSGNSGNSLRDIQVQQQWLLALGLWAVFAVVV